jgi:hypothetical protein
MFASSSRHECAAVCELGRVRGVLFLISGGWPAFMAPPRYDVTRVNYHMYLSIESPGQI